MKFLKDKILPLFIVVWQGAFLPSCIYEEEKTDSRPENANGFNISVAISASAPLSTRAYDGNLPQEDGTGAESYIHVEQLQIYAFTTDNTLLAQVYPKPSDNNVAMDPEINRIGDTYYLKAELSYDVFSQNQQFKLVAVANESQNVITTWDQLSEVTYIRTPETTNNNNSSWIPRWNESGIPMFGVQEVSLAGYNFKTNNEFNPYTLDDVNLLRAMAKIEVINAVEGTVGAISSVKLTSGYNTQGLIAPAGANNMTTTEDVTAANIPASPGSQNTELFFHKEAAGKFVVYVPEFVLYSNNRRDAITVNIAEKDYKLSLAPYTNGKPTEVNDGTYPWNALLRNHIYRYTITGMKVPALLVELMVEPWEVVPLNPDYQ